MQCDGQLQCEEQVSSVELGTQCDEHEVLTELRPEQYEPMSHKLLARYPCEMHKPMLGKVLYKAIALIMPREAGIVTNYMLEMDNNEIVMLLEDPSTLRCLALQARAQIRPR